MAAEPAIPLSQLGLDVPEPPAGWPFELERRGIAVFQDDVGRLSISRDDARHLLAEHRQQLEAAVRHQAEQEARWIAADAARRAALPKGAPVVAGATAAESLMASDPPDRGTRRVSLLEDALARRDEGAP